MNDSISSRLISFVCPATNHWDLCLSVQNPPQLSITSRGQNVPDNVQIVDLPPYSNKERLYSVVILVDADSPPCSNRKWRYSVVNLRGRIIATNHLCLSLQNPPEWSITSHGLKVPQNVQGRWSNDLLEEPLSGSLPGHLLGAKGRNSGFFDEVLVCVWSLLQ